MKNRLHFARTTLIALCCLLGAPAVAQDGDYVPEESSTLDMETAPDGWTHTVEFGAGISLSTSRDVIGQPNGNTFTLTLQARWVAELIRQNHEYRNTLSLNEAFSQTPLVDYFVKSADSLSTDSLYFYHLPRATWLGPFARAAIETALFKGLDVRADEVDYEISRNSGSVLPRTADRLALTTPFAPTRFKQSVGMFARPLDRPGLTLDFRLGVGAREVIADGNFVVADDETTDMIDVVELQSYRQGGAEFAVDGAGAMREGDITYGASLETLAPFFDSLTDNDLNAYEGTNVEASANAGLRVTDWMGVSYQFSALRIPLIVRDWQVTNQLLLTFSNGFTRGPRGEAADG